MGIFNTCLLVRKQTKVIVEQWILESLVLVHTNMSNFISFTKQSANQILFEFISNPNPQQKILAPDVTYQPSNQFSEQLKSIQQANLHLTN